MSVLSIEQDYQRVLADLSEVQREDEYLTSQRVPGDAKSSNQFFLQFWLSLYVRYMHISRRLAVIHDAKLQAQQLHDVRTLLDSCIGRMLEARAQLVRYCGDFVPLDNTLLDLKLTTEEAEVSIPTYVLDDREDELREWRGYIGSLQAHYADTEPAAPISLALAALQQRKLQAPLGQLVEDVTKTLPPLQGKQQASATSPAATAESETTIMPLDEAVRVLQVCERGRQARQRAKFQLALYRQRQYAAVHGQDFNTVTGKDRAAAVVQRVVRGYLERKRALVRYEREKEFLGLTPTAAILSDDERVAAAVRAQERKSRQRMNLAELRQKTLAMESQIKNREGPKTMEEMLDEVLMHMAYARLESKDGALVELPPAEEGGSLKLLGRMPGDKRATLDERRRRNTSRAGRSRSIGSNGNTGNGLGGAAAGGGEGAASAKSATGGGAAASEAGSPLLPSDEAGQRVSTITPSVSSRKAGRRGGGGEEAPALTLPSSALWGGMKEGVERYQTLWRDKFVRTYIENGELDQKVDETVLRQRLLEGPRGIMAELRKCVDQLIMIEVANLKARMESEKGGKRGKKNKKKGRAAKGPKKPKLKDPSKGIELDTLVNTAIYENKLQLPPAALRIRDFVGPENVMKSSLEQAQREQSGPDEAMRKRWQRILRVWDEEVERAMQMTRVEFEAALTRYTQPAAWHDVPSAAQIRRAVTEYAALPLGSQVIHDLAPPQKAMLFYGLPGTGKTMMAYALCNEVGANFFNLSPANFATTKGIAKAIQLVFTVARLKSPSVIYLEDVAKVFPAKKGGKKQKDALLARGKKMRGEIVKGLQTIAPTDRVLLVGVSGEPWNIDKGAIESVFQHAVYFPLPDYATRMSLLTHFARGKMASLNYSVPLPTLQHVSMLCDGCTAGQLRQVVEQTLHPRRVERLQQRQLETADFVPAIAGLTAPAETMAAMMDAFHAQLPLHLRRANPAEDFKASEKDGKKRKGTVAAPRDKAGSRAKSVTRE